MPNIVAGFVKNGVVVPNAPLPEGALDKRHCLYPLGVLDPATLDQIFAALDKLTGR